MNPYSVLSKNPTPKAAIRPNQVIACLLSCLLCGTFLTMGVADQPPCHLQDLCPEPVPAELVTEQEHCWAFSVLAYWTPLYKCFSPTTY
jgi:hypothetical protein